MTREETYKEFINIVCEMLGFNKPIDVLKLCQIASEFIMPYEKLITELEKENEQLKGQIEKMKNCENCKNLIQCTNRRYEKMTSGKMSMIRFSCCWELAE